MKKDNREHLHYSLSAFELYQNLSQEFPAFLIHVPCALQVTEGSSSLTRLLSIFVSFCALTCLGTPDPQIPKGVLSLPAHLLHSTEAGAE